LFGVTSRMVLGLALCLTALIVLRQRLPLHARALQTYLAAGIGSFGAMSLVYWGAQYIPSGLISVLFGLTPVVTGVMAAAWLNESSLLPGKILGLVLGLAGLGLIFGFGGGGNVHALWGIVALLCAVVLHSGTIVWIKRINASLHPLSAATGALAAAVPLYLLMWVVFDGQWPQTLSARSGLSIIYLATVGSVLGAVLFFYALKRTQASRLALIPLITPVNGLLIGTAVNGESIDAGTLMGTLLVLFGLVVYEFFGLLARPNLWRRRQAPKDEAAALAEPAAIADGD
jgi:drug/metabolite transporter (DMT)-like permease